MVELILASSSEVRAQILRAAGYSFRVVRSEVEEYLQRQVAAAANAERLAREKAEAVYALNPKAVVLAADTIVIAPDGTMLEKPLDATEAARNMAARSGASEQVVTGLCVLSARGREQRHCISSIYYQELDQALQQELIASGEWRGVCGGLRIEGKIGAKLERIVGSYTNIQGLPRELLAELLAPHGVHPSGVDQRA